MSSGGAGGSAVALVAMALALLMVILKLHGRSWWRRTLSTRAHPARATRIVIVASTTLGTAGLAAAMASDAPPATRPPIGWEADISDPLTIDATPTFVFYDRIPGKPRPEPPEPVTVSNASPLG